MSHPRALFVMFALALTAVSAGAGPRRPLPAATFLGRDGAQTTLEAAIGARKVVLIYVAPRSPASERLLQALPAWSPSVDAGSVVLVVDAQTAEAGQWVARLLPDGSPQPLVLFDIDGKGRLALEAPGAPTLMGVEGGEIRWDLAGVLNDPSALEPVIRNWTTQR